MKPPVGEMVMGLEQVEKQVKKVVEKAKEKTCQSRTDRRQYRRTMVVLSMGSRRRTLAAKLQLQKRTQRISVVEQEETMATSTARRQIAEELEVTQANFCKKPQNC